MSEAAPLTRRAMLAAASIAPFVASASAAAAAQGTSGGPPPRLTGRPMPQQEDEPPLPEGERLGWALVGLGKLTTNQLIPAFEQSKKARLAGFVSGSPEKLQDYGRRHGVTSLYGYDDWDRLAADKSIDVIYCVLPNALHRDYVIKALQAGKHVFCEKPMAPLPADCEAMIAAAKKAGRQLGIAYRAHFEPHNLEAMKRLREGTLGDLRFFTSDHGRILDPADPADQWRAKKALAGGGSLYDIGIYAMNAAIMFAGADPVEVSAAIDTPKGDPRFAEVEDVVSFRLRFPNGMIANCSSAYSYHDVKRYQLFGTKAAMKLDPATDYYENQIMVESDAGSEEIKVSKQSFSQFPAEIDGFCDAIRSGRPHITPGEMGLRDVRLMQAIYRSAKTGKPVAV